MKVLHKQNINREDGVKNSDIKVMTQAATLDKNGNPLPVVVAMISRCIVHYRKYMKPLKTIWLCPAHWNQFEYWSRSHMLEEQADAEIKDYTFDGVFIKRMERGHVIRSSNSGDMDWEFWPQKKNEA